MKWYENLKTSRKLIIGFLIVAIISAAVGIVGITNIIKIGKGSISLYDESIISMQYAGDIGLNFQQLEFDAAQLNTIDFSNKNEVKTVTDEMTALLSSISEDLGKLDEAVQDTQIQNIVNGLEANWTTYGDATKKVVEAALKNDTVPWVKHAQQTQN